MKHLLSIALLSGYLLAQPNLKATEPPKDLIKSLKSGAIDHAELFYLPQTLLSRTRIDEAMLTDTSNSFQKKIAVDRLGLLANLRKLERALMTAKPDPDGNPPDLRWGALFYDKSSRLRFTIFLDKFTSGGFIQGKLVVVDRHLIDWFREMETTTKK